MFLRLITVTVLLLMRAFMPFVDAATVPKLKFSDDPTSRNGPPPASFAPVIKKVAPNVQSSNPGKLPPAIGARIERNLSRDLTKAGERSTFSVSEHSNP